MTAGPVSHALPASRVTVRSPPGTRTFQVPSPTTPGAVAPLAVAPLAVAASAAAPLAVAPLAVAASAAAPLAVAPGAVVPAAAAAAAAATAPVPHERVSPEPRSCTRMATLRGPVRWT